ncbi:acyl-CoA dehydrogenase family protein [Vulcanisaeta thermophila]|uniref:acyl-CoA dehydrogenase family protein n=1 Tax=Vulcanisaeta thermophila TaxID=867917 RepID=UPI00085398C7|nr:acyl-CoA dehydrogenase family protein [Vulcanisaeta thermophila]
MDFGFSREEVLFRDSVREFGERYVKPHWIELDEGKYSLLDLIPRLAEHGLVGLTISSRYGGSEGSFLMAAIAAEELAKADPSLAVPVYFLLETAWPFIVQRYAKDSVKEEVLPRLVKGEAWIGIASTEPQGGSDVAGERTEAKFVNGKWLVTGEKSMVTGVSIALKLPYGGGFVTITRTGPLEARHRAITTFLLMVKRNGVVNEGIETREWDEWGRHGIPTNYLKLNNTPVDPDFILGEVNNGFKIAMEGFNVARTIIGAASIGSAMWLLEQGREWIKQRVVFGKPIASYQSISFKYAELHARLEAAKLMVYKAAWLADKFYSGDPAVSISDVAAAGAMAKMLAVEAAVDTGLEVMKWFGGMSYFRETPIARALLGILSYYVGAEGTQNIMRLIIARQVIGREVE